MPFLDEGEGRKDDCFLLTVGKDERLGRLPGLAPPERPASRQAIHKCDDTSFRIISLYRVVSTLSLKGWSVRAWCSPYVGPVTFFGTQCRLEQSLQMEIGAQSRDHFPSWHSFTTFSISGTGTYMW
jgi:hypothetical protein